MWLGWVWGICFAGLRYNIRGEYHPPQVKDRGWRIITQDPSRELIRLDELAAKASERPWRWAGKRRRRGEGEGERDRGRKRERVRERERAREGGRGRGREREQEREEEGERERSRKRERASKIHGDA